MNNLQGIVEFITHLFPIFYDSKYFFSDYLCRYKVHLINSLFKSSISLTPISPYSHLHKKVVPLLQFQAPELNSLNVKPLFK